MDSVKGTGAISLPFNFQLNITRAKIVLYRNTEVRLKGRVNKPSLVVLTDNWHKNWKATVNGVETPIFLINGTFRGVQVPLGEYEIYMYYQPRTLNAAIFSTVAIIFLLFYLIFDRRRIDSLLNLWFSGLDN